MTAATADRNTTHKDGEVQQYEMAAVQIFKGTMVAVEAGYLNDADDLVGAFVEGTAMDSKDNSAGSVGDLEMRVLRRKNTQMTFQDTLTQVDVGKIAWVVDDQTCSATVQPNHTRAGKITKFISATSGLVDLGKHDNALDPRDTPQNLTGAGAADLLTWVTHLITTSTDAITLADGYEGQHKTITMQTDGGVGTLTPTSADGWVSALYTDVGDTLHLLFTDDAWKIIGGTPNLVETILGSGATVQALSGNAQTITMQSTGKCVRVDAGGSARTGTILEVGTRDCEDRILVNEGGEDIDFNATPATANLFGTASTPALQAGESVPVFWDDNAALWVPYHLAAMVA